MKYISKIERLEKETFECPTCKWAIPFLLKAFYIMREIASDNYEWRFQNDPELMDKWDGKTSYGDEIDNEFEKKCNDEMPGHFKYG